MACLLRTYLDLTSIHFAMATLSAPRATSPAPTPSKKVCPDAGVRGLPSSRRVQAAAAFANITLESPTKVAKKLFDDAKLPESPKSVTDEQVDDLTRLRRQFVGEVDLPESRSRHVARVLGRF